MAKKGGSTESAGGAAAGEKPRIRLRAKNATPEQIHEAAVMIGSIVTPAKQAAARRVSAARKPEDITGRPPKGLLNSACTCTAGTAVYGHRWNCPRGQVIKRRLLKGATPEELAAEMGGTVGETAGRSVELAPLTPEEASE